MSFFTPNKGPKIPITTQIFLSFSVVVWEYDWYLLCDWANR